MKQKKQKNNTKAKKHIALWCAVGCLALAGTVGTITFGTLWFTNKNSGGGGSDTPTQENVRLNKTELELSVGESESLFAYVEPAGASQDVIWSCDDTNIATVTNGLVTAKAPGDATIIVKPINSDNIAMCAINVKPKPDPEPEPGNFETDEWSTVCYYADKGIDALHKAYAGNCQINTDFPGTLIGLERKVKINGLQHVVRVIDESVEEYGNKPFIKRAALTFQFEKIVSQHNKSALKTKWDDSSNHYYPGSDLYYFLNDEQSPNIQSVFELIKSENNDLANCIKPIWQKTTYCDDTGSMETWNDEVKLYEPSVANIFSGYGILQGYEANFSTFTLEYVNKIVNEGTQYRYYKNKVGDESLGSSTAINALIRKDLNNNACGYWFTTSCLKQTEKTVWNVTSDGKTDFSTVCSSDMGVVPCFCI